MEDPMMKKYAAKEPEETKVEETAASEVSEEVKAEEVKAEEAKAEEAQPLDLKSMFGLEDAEAIKKKIEVASKYEELEETFSNVKQELDGYKAFVDKAIDPRSYFSSEEGMYVESAKMKYPSLNYGAAEKLVGKDAKDMKPLEALVLNEMVEHADVNLSEDEAELLVLENLGMTKEDISEMEEGSLEEKKMRAKAKVARQQLASVQAAVKEKPETQTLVDFVDKRKAEVQAAQSEIRTAWEDKMADTVKSIKTLSIKDDAGEVYNFEVPDAYIQSMEKVMMDNVVAHGLKPDDNGLAEVKQNLHAYFWRDNAPKVLRAFEEDIRSKIQVETDAKYGTEKPSNISKDTAVVENTETGFESMKPRIKRIVI